MSEGTAASGTSEPPSELTRFLPKKVSGWSQPRPAVHGAGRPAFSLGRSSVFHHPSVEAESFHELGQPVHAFRTIDNTVARAFSWPGSPVGQDHERQGTRTQVPARPGALVTSPAHVRLPREQVSSWTVRQRH